MARRGMVFLMYHELESEGRALCQSEPGYLRYIVPEAVFRAQMNWLARDGWRGLSVGEALEQLPDHAWDRPPAHPPDKAVAITFDDGCETDLITAAPILKESGLHATFYITAGFLGRPGYLSPGQLQQLCSLGFEIGCHSMTHAYLNDLDEKGLKREIVESRSRLEDVIGKKVEHFSCPGGRYNAATLDKVREAEYRSLATSHAHLNSRASDLFALGRVAIMRGVTEIDFQRTCQGGNLWKTRLGESVRNASRNTLGNALYDRVRTFLLR
jgi:peptidoglycan/xylan/chitin deacetylase (PgdA/CDA1 family)